MGTVAAKPEQQPSVTIAGGPASAQRLGTRRWRPRFPASIGVLLGASVVLFAVFWLLDVVYFGRRSAAAEHVNAWHLLVDLDPETLQNALGSLVQVVVAVLAIAITVVSIVVQLAATRYTPRIAEMFFRDKKNLAIMGFFVVACIDAGWVSVVVSNGFVPRATVAMTMVVVTASLLMLLPYFAYVFAFLDPEKVIARIGHGVLDAVLARGHAKRDCDDSDLRQATCVAGLEHLSDIAVNSLAQKDRIITNHAITALREFAVQYLAAKANLPAAWFTVGKRLLANPDFIALAPDSLHSIEQRRVWVEWKVLHHYRTIFSEALEQLPEIAHVVAIETRYLGDEALKREDREALALACRYFNTFLRTAIDRRNVRAAYNLFHQYRLLAEHMMRKAHGDLVIEVGRRLSYYGQIARAAGLDFATETAAHDLAVLCERTLEHQSACHDALLDILLALDKAAKTAQEEHVLRGVRKAQIRLATFYLVKGAQERARRVCADMRSESAERMTAIRAELMAVTSREFWEVTDRGVNFDYLDDSRKQKLDEVFACVALR
jgi:hypothetical protein